MTSNTDYWYSAPEVAPDRGLYAERDSFPEPVHTSAASTANIKPDQWPLPQDQYWSGTPHHGRNIEEQSSEAQYSERQHHEGEQPTKRYLDVQQHPGGHHSGAGHREAPEYNRKHVCGLRSRLFWTLLIVITVVIVGAAVGVGVGVSLARRPQSAELGSPPSPTSFVSTSSTSSVSTSLSSSASVVPTTTTTQSTSVTTTSIVGPSSTLYRDCPSSNNQLHDVTLGSKTYMFRKFCNTVLVSSSNDNTLVNLDTSDLNTCINRCALYNDENGSKIAASGKPCNTVCWWNSLDTQLPGRCWGFTTRNSSAGDFQFEQNVICDSAGWINES